MVTVSERKPVRVRVGAWTADPATNELRRDGRVVRLEPKPMDVLKHLAARPGEVVSREELLADVWPGVVVVDEALTQSVARLRRALGDGGYIETIAKRGYRLTAPVGADAPPASAPRTSRRRAILAASGVAIVAVIAALALQPDPANPPPASPEREPEWITVTVAPFESL